MKNGMKEYLNFKIKKELNGYLKDSSLEIKKNFFKEVLLAASDRLYFEALVNNSIDRIIEELADPNVTHMDGLTANEFTNFKRMATLPEQQRLAAINTLKKSNKLLKISADRQDAATKYLRDNIGKELIKYHDTFVEILNNNGINSENYNDYNIDYGFTKATSNFRDPQAKIALALSYDKVTENIYNHLDRNYNNPIIFLNNYYSDEIKLYFQTGAFNEPITHNEAHKGYEFLSNIFNNIELEKDFEKYVPEGAVNNGRPMPAKVLFDKLVSTQRDNIEIHLKDEYKKVLLGQESNFSIYDFDSIKLNQVEAKNGYETLKEIKLTTKEKKEVWASISTDDVVATFTTDKLNNLCSPHMTKEDATRALTTLKSLKELHSQRSAFRKLWGWIFKTSCGKEGAMIDKINSHLLAQGLTQEQINAAINNKESFETSIERLSTKDNLDDELKVNNKDNNELKSKEIKDLENEKVPLEIKEDLSGFVEDSELDIQNNSQQNKEVQKDDSTISL